MQYPAHSPIDLLSSGSSFFKEHLEPVKCEYQRTTIKTFLQGSVCDHISNYISKKNSVWTQEGPSAQDPQTNRFTSWLYHQQSESVQENRLETLYLRLSNINKAKVCKSMTPCRVKPQWKRDFHSFRIFPQISN